VADAVPPLVHDGDYLSIGGFGGLPAFRRGGHEIVRRTRQNPPLPVGPGPTQDTATHEFPTGALRGQLGLGARQAGWPVVDVARSAPGGRAATGRAPPAPTT